MNQLIIFLSFIFSTSAISIQSPKMASRSLEVERYSFSSNTYVNFYYDSDDVEVYNAKLAIYNLSSTVYCSYPGTHNLSIAQTIYPVPFYNMACSNTQLPEVVLDCASHLFGGVDESYINQNFNIVSAQLTTRGSYMYSSSDFNVRNDVSYQATVNLSSPGYVRLVSVARSYTKYSNVVCQYFVDGSVVFDTTIDFIIARENYVGFYNQTLGIIIS